MQSLKSVESGQEAIRVWEERFRRWEGKILQSPAVKRKYDLFKDARTAWKHALLHENDGGVLTTQHFCYDVITGHIDLSTVAEEDRQRYLHEVSTFTAFVQFGLANKFPFVSSTGHIGVAEGVDYLEIGDLVCLFPGVAVPFILRPLEKNCYGFVGACYI